MSNRDSLFYFIDRLKDWAQVELERQGVQYLEIVIIEVGSLIHYSSQLKEKKTKYDKGEGQKSKRSDYMFCDSNKIDKLKTSQTHPNLKTLASFVMVHIG